MSTVATPAPVKQPKAVEDVVQAASVTDPAAVPSAPPEEPALLRDWVMLLVWLGGAAILILMHFTDLLAMLVHR
ncbi:MAG: hypothetical protein HYS12_22235 [Planctomycetes bacterium]|nr:hypothetical protein [Planctomycetota bacterium]